MRFQYCDMHCDTLTAEGALQATPERHKQGGCFLQCFAAFLFRPDGSLYRRALALFRPRELDEYAPLGVGLFSFRCESRAGQREHRRRCQRRYDFAEFSCHAFRPFFRRRGAPRAPFPE